MLRDDVDAQTFSAEFETDHPRDNGAQRTMFSLAMAICILLTRQSRTVGLRARAHCSIARRGRCVGAAREMSRRKKSVGEKAGPTCSRSDRWAMYCSPITSSAAGDIINNARANRAREQRVKQDVCRRYYNMWDNGRVIRIVERRREGGVCHWYMCTRITLR